MTSENQKLCINCKHMAGSPNGWENFRCLAPQNEKGTNMVTGSKLYHITFCKDHRNFNPTDAFCGSEGKWWEEKPLHEAFKGTADQLKKLSIRGITADDL